MAIQKLIAELEETLAEHSPETLASFLLPLPKEEVIAFFDKLGVHDEDLIELYTWRNGYKAIDIEYDELWPFVGSFSSFNDILLSINLNQSLREEDECFAYSSEFIDIFGSDGMSYLFCASNNDDYGKLFFYSSKMGINKPVYEIESLKVLIKAIIVAYKDKYIYYNGNGQKDSIDDSFLEVIKKIKPG